MSGRRSLLALALVLASGCATTAPAPQPAATAAETLPANLQWVRASAEYRAAVVQTYRAAADRLRELVGDRSPGTWAVVVDADETLISNSLYQKERAEIGESFSRESWAEWVEREAAPALPGAEEFLAEVRRLGGRIAVVTNRAEALCPATRRNLRAVGLPFDVVLCRPAEGPSEKAPRWHAVEAGTTPADLPPLDIVLWIGDSIRDFPGGSQELAMAPIAALSALGDRYFIVPNPLYGSWEENPPR